MKGKGFLKCVVNRCSELDHVCMYLWVYVYLKFITRVCKHLEIQRRVQALLGISELEGNHMYVHILQSSQ